MKKQVTIGDIVRLNSGSPDLEIIDCQDEKVTVRWSTEVGFKNYTLPSVCVYAV
jgi:uncharacterized protein YodC (DUF2158 family)